MGTSKRRFFWLKLKNDFFDAKEIKKLRRIAGGDTFTIIYLKMLLKSITNEGRLYFEGVEDNFIEELALDIDEEVDNVKVTVLFLQKQGLLLTCDDVEYTLPQAVENVGSEGVSAERMRRMRQSEKQKLLSHSDGEASHCAHIVKKSDVEIEIEIEKDINNNIKSCKQDNTPSKKQKNDTEFLDFNKNCIEYLNKVVGAKYKTDNKATVRALKARYNEGFTFEDVKTAIDKKAAEWLGTDMEKYLRPATLFGNKLEAYVNQKGGVTNGKHKADIRRNWQRNDWNEEPENL